MARPEVALTLAGLGLADAPEELRAAAATALEKHGDLASGVGRLQGLRAWSAAEVDLGGDAPTARLRPLASDPIGPEAVLRALGPWKKGPFRLRPAGREPISIDAEWRSDLKWRRLWDLGVTFSGKRVLDVGTGNGYFLLRLEGAGAQRAIGLEPSLRSVLQYLALCRLFPSARRSLWPLRLEELPNGVEPNDLVMSMGVLYHQRDARAHLARLRQLIAPGGELVLETLVTRGALPLYLAPGERYAGMRNVYVIPSQAVLLSWLKEAGLTVAALGKPVLTTSSEQRSTDWAPGPSLEDVLAPGAGHADDPARTTREGHDRPLRLMLRAVPTGGAER